MRQVFASYFPFMQSQNLYNLIKSNTHFKGGRSCIDLILTNKRLCFKNSSKFEIGQTAFKKEEPKSLIYRDYKNFSNECFQNGLNNKLCDCSKNYESFENTFVTILDRHAARKTKILRGNQKSHTNKNLRKAII